MKIAISLPDALIKQADAAARELGMSRSQLIRTALEEFLKRRRDEAVTGAINRYVAEHGAELSEEEEAWLEHSRQTVLRELADDDWGPEGRVEGRTDGRTS